MLNLLFQTPLYLYMRMPFSLGGESMSWFRDELVNNAYNLISNSQTLLSIEEQKS
jgi:hypothetical protein